MAMEEPADYATRQLEGLQWNPLSRLRAFDANLSILIDPMHTLCGVGKSLWKLMQGLREFHNVDAYERQINMRTFEKKHVASKDTRGCLFGKCMSYLIAPSGDSEKIRMTKLLREYSEAYPANQAGSRLTALFTAWKKARMHHFLFLAGD